MSDLINKIRRAQIIAGEEAVIRDLEEKGLIPKEKNKDKEILINFLKKHKGITIPDYDSNINIIVDEYLEKTIN